MFALKVLSGSQAGQTFVLEKGSYKFGRSVTSSFQFHDNSISKNHLEILAVDGKFVLRDLGSANGTFVNGVRVQGSVLQIGDEIMIGDVRCVIVPVETKRVFQPKKISRPQNVEIYHGGMMTPDMNGSGGAPPPMPMGPPPPDFQSKMDDLKESLLGGIYRMLEVFDFRSVLGIFLTGYVLLVTVLSTIPMKYISSESIAAESRRRSLSLARSFAQKNLPVVRNQDATLFQADSVMREEGTDDYYILSQEGTIIAPPERAGGYPKEIAFARKIRGQTHEFSEELDSGQVISAVPLLIFDPELQANSAKAHAVVVYNPGTLKYDDGRALSLFVQILLIAGILGSILFFIFVAVIEKPLVALNRSLDESLREDMNSLNSNIRYPKFQQLIVNINSLLTRAQQTQAKSSDDNKEILQTRELEHVMDFMGFPSLLLAKGLEIRKMNRVFLQLFGNQIDQSSTELTLSSLTDSAFQQNVMALVEICETNSQEIVSDTLDISGQALRINCQAFFSTEGTILHFLIVLTPPEDQSNAGTGGCGLSNPNRALVLVEISPQKETKRHVLGAKQAFTIGRSLENDVVIQADSKVSRQHLRLISSRDGSLKVQNLSDKNTATVNGALIPANEEVSVEPGARFQIGDTEFELRSSELPARLRKRPTTGYAAGAAPAGVSDGIAGIFASKKARFRIIVGILLLIVVVGLLKQTPHASGPATVDPLKLRDESEIAATLTQHKDEIDKLEKGIQSKGEDTVQYRLAQENYQRGFRDYLQGQYGHAIEGFQAALSFYPQHAMSQKYLTLARRKYEEQIETYLILGKRYYGTENYRLCKANMATAVRLDKNEDDPVRKEAIQIYKECDLKLRGALD